MDMFALDDEVSRLELALSPLRGSARLAVLEPLVWYLRQRDTGRANIAIRVMCGRGPRCKKNLM